MKDDFEQLDWKIKKGYAPAPRQPQQYTSSYDRKAPSKSRDSYQHQKTQFEPPHLVVSPTKSKKKSPLVSKNISRQSSQVALSEENDTMNDESEDVGANLNALRAPRVQSPVRAREGTFFRKNKKDGSESEHESLHTEDSNSTVRSQLRDRVQKMQESVAAYKTGLKERKEEQRIRLENAKDGKTKNNSNITTTGHGLNMALKRM